MKRERRAVLLLALAFLGPSCLHAQPLTVLDVPFIAQSELLRGCRGRDGDAILGLQCVRWVELSLGDQICFDLIRNQRQGLLTES